MKEALLFIIGIPCVVIIWTILYCAAGMAIAVCSAPLELIDTLIERRNTK